MPVCVAFPFSGGDGASPAPASAAGRRLAAEGNKIAAIKLLRDETGPGLEQAKDLVDRL